MSRTRLHISLRLRLLLIRCLPCSVNLSVHTAVGTPGSGLATTCATSRPCLSVLNVLLAPRPQAAYICGVSELAPSRFTTLASVTGSIEGNVSTSKRLTSGRGSKKA